MVKDTIVDGAEFGTPSAPPFMDSGGGSADNPEEIHGQKGSAQGCPGSEAVVLDARAQGPIHEPNERYDEL